MGARVYLVRCSSYLFIASHRMTKDRQGGGSDRNGGH